MLPRTVKLLRDFKEDNRISMDIYADFLSKGIKKYFSDEFEVSEYVPRVPKHFKIIVNNNLKMRLLRYASYPSQIKHFDQNIFHIIEHGYAHLLTNENIKNKAIVTVHDLIPMMQWKGLIQGMESINNPRGSIYSLNRLENAKQIIAISENSKRDLVQLLGLNPNKIEVIYYGVGEEFKVNRTETKEELRKRFNLPHEDTKLILITGQELYKNHKTCLKVMRILEKNYDKPIRMVRLGKNYPEWEDFEKESQLQNKVIQIEKLRLPEVARLYNCVDFLLFPSFYEGFGRPPVEAMACGLPVVCSNAASLPEVVGSAALVANPNDEDGLAKHILNLLKHSELRDSLIGRGFENIKRFSWHENINKTISLYNKVLDENIDKTKKIVFFHRKMPFYGSIELYFSGVRNFLSSNYNLKVFQSRYNSQGVFNRVFNIFEAFFHQNDINHITGDVHFLSYLMNRKKTILSIMDCGSVVHSGGLKRKLYQYFWFTLPSKKVSAITVISEKTKKELLSVINYPQEKIHVIPVCLNTQFTYERKSSFNKSRPKIMHIGTTQNKNLSRVCLALKDVNCHLEIIGKLDESTDLPRLRKYNISFSNSFALEQEQLIQKYLETDMLIFASIYEGFGVPIIEAQSMGIPVITSNVSPMIEVSGGSAALVNPYDIDEIKHAIYKITDDDEYRESLITNGLINAKKYHPEKIAAMFEKLYSTL